MSLHDISSIILPFEVKVESGENQLDFALTTSASITGTINVTENSKTKFAEENKDDAKSVIIEVKNKEEVFRKICSLNEKFNFTNLRPGKWEVKIDRNGLNKLFNIKVNAFTLEVASGESSNINVEIIKKERKIKFLQEGMKVTHKLIKDKK